MTDQVKVLRKENPEKTVVVAFALYLKSSRDYIRKITGEPVSFVQFKVTAEEIVARNKPRVTEFCKAAGKTEAEAWVMWGLEEKHGKFVEGVNNWQKIFLEFNFLNGMEDFVEGETDCHVIDSGIASAGTVPGLERELGLSHIENPDIKAVCQINFDRGGVSIKAKQVNEDEWMAITEATLTKSSGAFLEGDSPKDEDHTLFKLMFTNLGSEKMPFKRNLALTEEAHPKTLAWKAKMEGLQKKD